MNFSQSMLEGELQNAPRAKYAERGRALRLHSRKAYQELTRVNGLDMKAKHRVEALLSLAVDALWLQGVILLQSATGMLETNDWHASDSEPSQVLAARTHASECYRELVDPAAVMRDAVAGATSLHADIELAELWKEATAASPFLVLPLSGSSARPFGVLYFSGYDRFDESDLAFADAIGAHLAVALEGEARAQRRSEEELASVERVRYRDDLLATVSHDLKNPLCVILLAAEQLRRSDVCEMREVQAIGRAARRMLRQIEDLLDAASIAEQRLSIELARQPLGTILDEELESFTSIAAAKGIALSLDCPVDLPPVLGDRQRLQQVLANLIGNALKFTPPLGSIRVRVRSEERYVRVAISDTGPGISPDNLPHVFERFWHSPRTAPGGTGLGLYIAKTLIEAQGGEIRASNGVVGGSIFEVTIPRPPLPETGDRA